MSTVAEFLKGKVNESLTTLVQPAGLVPATLFVLLNLAFVYPALKTEVGLLGTFGGLDATWQVVTVAVLILLLGYLLLSASSSVLALLTGDSWRDSWLYATFREHTQEGLLSRNLSLLPESASADALDRLWDVRAGYPIKAPESANETTEATRKRLDEVGPTALGNVLRASRRLIFDRWGIDPAALWPQMEAAIPKDSPAKTSFTDAKASLDTLAGVSFVLAVFAVEGLMLHSARGAWVAALFCALALPAAYLIYRAAVVKARGFGDAMEVVFDLHRDDLRKELQLVSPSSPENERNTWRKVSQLFLWGRAGVAAPDDVFERSKETPAAATITVSRNARLERHHEAKFTEPRQRGAAQRHGEYVEYQLVITTRRGPAGTAVVALSDKQVPRIRSVPTPDVVPETPLYGHVEGEGLGVPNTLVWLVDAPSATAVWLAFELPIWEIAASTGLVITEATRRRDELSFDVSVSAANSQSTVNNPSLDIFVSETVSVPILRDLAVARPPLRLPQTVDNRHRFDLSGIGLPAKLQVSFPPERPT